MGIEEQHAGEVGPIRRAFGGVVGEVTGEEHMRETIPGQDIVASPEYHRGYLGHGIDEPHGAGGWLLGSGRSSPLGRAGPREGLEMGTLVVSQL
jgi:hypothetical protein